jgi:hypothetical protein
MTGPDCEATARSRAPTPAERHEGKILLAVDIT